MKVSAQCHRVNVSDGHMAAVRVRLKRAAKIEELHEAFAAYRSLPQELGLHSAPPSPIVVRDRARQTATKADRGMRVRG